MEEDDVIVSREIDSEYFKLVIYDTYMDQLPVIKVQQEEIGTIKTYYKLFVNNLKENRIIILSDYGSDPLVIRANENTINKLVENIKKMYLVE